MIIENLTWFGFAFGFLFGGLFRKYKEDSA